MPTAQRHISGILEADAIGQVLWSKDLLRGNQTQLDRKAQIFDVGLVSAREFLSLAIVVIEAR